MGKPPAAGETGGRMAFTLMLYFPSSLPITRVRPMTQTYKTDFHIFIILSFIRKRLVSVGTTCTRRVGNGEMGSSSNHLFLKKV